MNNIKNAAWTVVAVGVAVIVSCNAFTAVKDTIRKNSVPKPETR